MDTNSKIKSFSDLIAWKESHKLVLMIYEITKLFPKEETLGLTPQLCRAVVSITSNIAEGFSRNSNKEKIHFYSISLGSLTEVESQLIIVKDLKYISLEKSEQITLQITTVNKLIHGLMKTAQSKHT